MHYCSSNLFVRRLPPTPRSGIYDLYWRFAAKRQQAFERRQSGAAWPWTDDRILQKYKFCNVFRAADRVSQYMIREVVYADDLDSPADRLFQIVAFRTFSNITTWDNLRKILGGSPKLSDLSSGAFESALEQIKRVQGGLYTGAFILCANKAFGFDAKHRNHVALFKMMFNQKSLAERLLGAPKLEVVVSLLEEFPLMGPFMAYQTAIDLNYSAYFRFSENGYTQAGPGALRGLAKAFCSLGEYSPKDAILWMTENQDDEFERLGWNFKGLYGRKLHAIDCQGLFCELDKYCREAAPELASNRTRIKARFNPSPTPPPLFFPPKWDLRVEPDALTIPNDDLQLKLTFY